MCIFLFGGIQWLVSSDSDYCGCHCQKTSSQAKSSSSSRHRCEDEGCYSTLSWSNGSQDEIGVRFMNELKCKAEEENKASTFTLLESTLLHLYQRVPTCIASDTMHRVNPSIFLIEKGGCY
ncbi:hypothetical protein EGR_10949 [Echinococcus granulosus]|uniref:Uncharacterized protein n=1 Tax=Echinococcus granulosus TaxID=6210 RepID=W6TZL6_ECHGR|nr:hypothetical protein EGR_10949 [Echinococcus granulosus]EUB54188.1 hypothetical protein EGR_10949 [Echinococcus granulosus]